MLLDGPDAEQQSSIEGLAYATLQPRVQEIVAHDSGLLRKIIKTLGEAPAKSPVTYGSLCIFANLTRYPPDVTEEERKVAQLKAYAMVAGKLPEPDPLQDNAHVEARCKAVFEAEITPVLVTHSKDGSPASLALIVSIITSLSATAGLCGPLAQQGAVKLLLLAWNLLPENPTSTPAPRRVAAQALARILIRTDPQLVFGGNRSTAMSRAIEPLISLLAPEITDGPRNMLPTFESLMALTNLASADDETRRYISRLVWPPLDDLLISSVAEVSRASVELVCNLVQEPSIIEQYFAPTATGPASGAAKNRLNILLALTDSESMATRSGAGGALASLTGDQRVVRGIVERERGIHTVLKLCNDDEENLRHRGVFVIYNMAITDGEVGSLARDALRQAGALKVLQEVAKKTRSQQILEVAVNALKVILDNM